MIDVSANNIELIKFINQTKEILQAQKSGEIALTEEEYLDLLDKTLPFLQTNAVTEFDMGSDIVQGLSDNVRDLCVHIVKPDFPVKDKIPYYKKLAEAETYLFAKRSNSIASLTVAIFKNIAATGLKI